MSVDDTLAAATPSGPTYPPEQPDRVLDEAGFRLESAVDQAWLDETPKAIRDEAGAAVLLAKEVGSRGRVAFAMWRGGGWSDSPHAGGAIRSTGY